MPNLNGTWMRNLISYHCSEAVHTLPSQKAHGYRNLCKNLKCGTDFRAEKLKILVHFYIMGKTVPVIMWKKIQWLWVKRLQDRMVASWVGCYQDKFNRAPQKETSFKNSKMTKGIHKNSMHFSVESPLHLIKNFQIQKKGSNIHQR